MLNVYGCSQQDTMRWREGLANFHLWLFGYLGAKRCQAGPCCGILRTGLVIKTTNTGIRWALLLNMRVAKSASTMEIVRGFVTG